MTSHKLAQILLSLEDLPIRHHYVHQDDFSDYPVDFVSHLGIIEENGKIYITHLSLEWEDYFEIGKDTTIKGANL